jgi:DNA replication and repair protein RecF
LSLSNFRNYVHLEFDLPPHIMVLLGDNAQGKSNFLEAIYLLATAKSPRTAADSELINWLSWGEPPVVARLAAEVELAKGDMRVELALQGKVAPQGSQVEKRIRINGVPRRAIDIIGVVTAVLFSTRDIELIGGEPALRRRYLDIVSSEVDRRYLRTLQRYNRVLWQRNHLLHLIAEHKSSPEELDFWDRELVAAGCYLLTQRQHTVARLDELALGIHEQLSGGREGLKLLYRGSVSADDFHQALYVARAREIASGMTLVGPHRDDLRFLVNEMDMGTYGSRGQNRTIAISLRLAEAQFIAANSGDSPILLLDDVLSELDALRRRHLLDAASQYEQVLITATDLHHFESDFLSQAAKFRVSAGELEPL